MVVICPKCKVRLKVAEQKIAAQGTRFKCPKCSTVLLVRRPVMHERLLDENKILLAHEDSSILERIKSILTADGYKVVTVADGIAAMVSATKELPFLALLSVSLPKIFGFEVSARLKKRHETKDIKVILLASLYDKNRYRREPSSFYGADAYLEDHQIEESLLEKVDALRGTAPKRAAETPTAETPREQGPAVEGDKAVPETKAEEIPGESEKPKQPFPGEKRSDQQNDLIEKAKRLSRTIVSDIHLYGRAKVDEAIKNNTFHVTFASELREGMKLYENRIPAEVRKLGDFFNEAVNNFIDKRKRDLASKS
ncbi:MAG TPA: hypothetical protein DCP92_22575 [Nitrospiraceae bacterium]|nr:hypothetical protein [Nitrospiraceae bacterium]